MKKNLKKVLAAGLAASMVLSISVPAFADETPRNEYEEFLNKPANFTKEYNIVNDNNGSKSPAETFTFEFEKVGVEEVEEGVTIDNMPSIEDVTTEFAALTADPEEGNIVPVNLAASMFPGIGIYTYKVTEKVGDTAGVTYNEEPHYLVVTILRDSDDAIKYVGAIHYETADGEKTGSIVNEYSAGTLAVKKIVTGNMGEKDRDFNVTVTFTAPTGVDAEGKEVDLVVREAITYTDDGETKTIAANWNDEKTVTIDLKHDETVTFINIPYGVTYKVAEEDYTTVEKGGYDAATYNYTGVSEDVINGESPVYDFNETKGMAIGGEVAEEIEIGNSTFVFEDSCHDHRVEITNNKGAIVDTGISLDALPYLMMLGMSGLGALGFAGKRRKEEDEI